MKIIEIVKINSLFVFFSALGVANSVQAQVIAQSSVSSVEAQYQESQRLKKLKEEREADKKFAAREALQRDYSSALKFLCYSTVYAILGDKAYKGQDYTIRNNIENFKNSRESHDEISYKSRLGVSRFNRNGDLIEFEFNYHETLDVKKALLYTHHRSGEVSREKCSFMGGDENAVAK